MSTAVSTVSRFLLASSALSAVAFAHAEGTPLGKLGQATKKVALYASPTTRSRAYYTTKAFEYLIVRTQPTKTGWVRILMVNGVDAYAKKDAIAMLPYEVSTKAGASRAAAPAGSRAALARGGTGSAVANYALKFQGTPYVWGGNDLNKGIDCSGFVKQLYGSVGVNLPRTAAEQALVGQPITRLENLQPGDRLYFWEKKRNKIGHTGIYMGNGYFVHSSRGHNGVATDVLSERWQKILVAARR